MDELSNEARERIEREAIAQVVADRWRRIDRFMRALEGDAWAAEEEEAVVIQIAEGPERGKLFWQVGDRQFVVEEYVVETTVVDGRPVRRRVIGSEGEGVLVDGALIDPTLN